MRTLDESLTHAVCQECGQLEPLHMTYPIDACLSCGCRVFWLVPDAAEAREASRTVVNARHGEATASVLAGYYAGAVARSACQGEPLRSPRWT
jgi:predicted  nucleic acid-binding Zn-ribbon protein